MKVKNNKEGDVVMLHLQGSMEILNYSAFDSAIKEFFKGEEKKLLLDCSDLVYISSSGLRIFMTAYKQALENGVLMVVCGLQDSVNYVFDVTGFNKLLNICMTRKEAIEFLKD